MTELYTIAFSQVNIALTILLLVLFLYWIVSMLSGLDFELDFDVEFDLDVDMDIDVDVGSSLEAGHLAMEEVAGVGASENEVIPDRRRRLKWWQTALVYFNFTDLPFMFAFTFWVLCWWFLTVISTYLTGTYDSNAGMFFFFGSMIPALALNKIVTTPFKSFFKNFSRTGEKALNLVGEKGTALSNIKGDRIGSIKIVLESSPINIYGKSLDGEEIKTHEEVLIVRESSDKKYYYIKKFGV